MFFRLKNVKFIIMIIIIINLRIVFGIAQHFIFQYINTIICIC